MARAGERQFPEIRRAPDQKNTGKQFCAAFYPGPRGTIGSVSRRRTEQLVVLGEMIWIRGCGKLVHPSAVPPPRARQEVERGNKALLPCFDA